MRNWKMPDREGMVGSRGLNLNEGDFDLDGNPASSPTTPLAFNGSPGRRLSYVRSQSLNGRIQKPSVARSQSFNGTKCAKLGGRSHHMDALQSQIKYMRASGADQKKFGIALKGSFFSTGEGPQQQQQEDGRTALRPPSIPSSPLSSCSSPQTFPPPRVEDLPTSTSSITLLQNKFAKWHKYKESIEGQQIPPYRSPSFHSGNSSAQRTPVSSTPCSPRVQLEDSYSFDEETAALVARQQEMMSNSFRSAASSGISPVAALNSSPDNSFSVRSPLILPEGLPIYRNRLSLPDGMAVYRSPLNSPESMGPCKSPLSSQTSMGSRSPGEWSACESPTEDVVFGRMSLHTDEAPDEFEYGSRYMRQPSNAAWPFRHNSNLEAFQNMSLAGGAAAAKGNRGPSGGTAIPDSLGGLLAAERREILMTKKAAAAAAAAAASESCNHRATETKLASSIQQVVAKFPFNLTAKFSSPKSKLQGSWGKSLSLNTPIVPTPPDYYHRGNSSWESSPSFQNYHNSGVQMQCYKNNENSSSSGQELGSSDIYMKQQELIDTSLHL